MTEGERADYSRRVEPLVGIPLVALAVVMLAASTWAVMTTERRFAWFLTAVLLWTGGAWFTTLALVGAGPVALVVLGWTLVGAGLLTAILALAESRLVRHVVFGRQTSSSDVREREAAPAVASLQPR
jgi:hypothetical protein